MEYKKFGNKYFIGMVKGEEIVETLKQFCEEQNIKLGTVNGLGAVNKAKIGYFEPATKQYHSTELTGDHEITTLYGNISTMKGDVYLHIHANLSDTNFNTHGGHLNLAVVSAVAELIVEAIEGELDREFNNEAGLNLYKF